MQDKLFSEDGIARGFPLQGAAEDPHQGSGTVASDQSRAVTEVV